jgi:hypothetical protein
MHGGKVFNKPIAMYKNIIHNSRAWLGYNGFRPVFLNIPNVRPSANIRSQRNVVNGSHSQRAQPCKHPFVVVEIGFYRRRGKYADMSTGLQVFEEAFRIVFVVPRAVVAGFQATAAGYALAVFYSDLNISLAVCPGKIRLIYGANSNATVTAYTFVKVIGNYISHTDSLT